MKEPPRGRPHPVTPDPVDPGLVIWMERLFDGQHPQKIQAIQLTGANATRMGPQIELETFKATDPKPTKEALVELANRFYRACQKNTDMTARPQRYGILAIDDRKDSKPYSRYPLMLKPESVYTDEHGEPILEEGFGPEAGEDFEKYGSDKLLRRSDKIWEDDRWRQNHFSQSMGSIQQLLQEENARLRTQNDQLMKQVFEAMKDRETALSGQADRDLARDKQRFWLTEMKEGTTLVKGLLPTAISKITGAPVPPGTKPPEQLVIENFINNATMQQVRAAFGIIEGDGVKQAGVFDIEQVHIIDGVYSGRLGVDSLDGLISGENAVRPDQVELAQKIFTDGQLLPLMAMIFERRAKMAAAPKSDKQ